MNLTTRLHLVLAEAKNEWSYASSAPTCLHTVNRDNFKNVNELQETNLSLYGTLSGGTGV
jgi:hypothetical protein